MQFKVNIPAKLKDRFSLHGKRKQELASEAAEIQNEVTQSLGPILPTSHASSRLRTPNPASSQRSLSTSPIPSASLSLQTWTLDKDFFRQVYDWNSNHPENTLDRILNGICASIDRHKELLETVPNGPVPFRGFVKALVHLVSLGANFIEAKATALRFAKDIVQHGRIWLKLDLSFVSHELLIQSEYLIVRRKVIEGVFAWAHRMLNGGSCERLSVNDEILKFQMQFTQTTARFGVLSDINLARGQDNLVQMVQQIQPPPAMPDASYEFQKKYPCDPGTRTEILDDIMEWIDDISDTARCFFWMSGDPGVGKSAITASIAKACIRRKILWAQFFINRNDARTIDPQLFFPSIAKQMSASSLAVEHAVQKALKEQPYLMNDDVSKEQATKLFVDTIRVASEATPTMPVVIVIDALDETDFKRLNDTVKVLSQVVVGLPRNVKVFISSRAENVIRDNFAPHLTNLRVRHIHLSAKESIPEVTRFLEKKVAEIMKENNLDWSQWGEDRMRKLCTQASGLFIWAVTAIAYIRIQIEEAGTEYLGVVLDQLNTHGMHDINMLYLTILKRTYQGENDPWGYERFRRIMGAILVQQSPLCVEDLKGLLDLRNPTIHAPVDIKHFVRRMRTVLVAGVGEINKRTFPRVHKSFSDFVTSAAAEDFCVDTIKSDGELAIQCIRQLNRLWERETSAKPELQMPAQLPYAVSHWSSHLIRVVGMKLEEAEADNNSISTPEADGIVSVNTGAQAVAKPREKRSYPSGKLYCIAVSPDTTRIAVAQGPSIRLRDTQTGDEVLAPILGHTESVYFVAFSPDGRRIVSAGRDNTIRIWDSATGDMVFGPLRGHTDTVLSTVFSPDGRRIASASADETVRIWDSDTGNLVLGPLKGHTDVVRSAVFSPDGRLIVSASRDGTIRVWSSETGNMVLGPLHDDYDPVSFAVFSADGRHICHVLGTAPSSFGISTQAKWSLHLSSAITMRSFPSPPPQRPHTL